MLESHLSGEVLDLPFSKSLLGKYVSIGELLVDK